jgi:hypothetical protein
MPIVVFFAVLSLIGLSFSSNTAANELAPPFDEGAIPEALQQAARDVRDLPIGERMQRISDVMLGQPYLVDAIGEGVYPDLDPPARYDAFDCLTFVEEVLSLAIPADPNSAPMVRNQLRYTDGEAAYENRRHFMLQQWIPENIENGFLKNITAQFGETQLIEKTVTPQTWNNWRRRALFQLTDDQLPTGTFSIPVLSLDAAIVAADQLPQGALVVAVRKNVPHIPILVTHLGFVVKSGNVPRMRHATKLGRKHVRDHGMEWYFDFVRWYDWWPVEGITILMPQERGPRMSRLRSDASPTATIEP